MSVRFSFFVLLIVVLNACNSHPESLNGSEYKVWAVSENSGLMKARVINGVMVKAQYLPSEYLAYRDFIATENSNVSFDSILNSYKCGMTFQVTLTAPKNAGQYGSLNHYKVSTREELASRIQILSFHTEDFMAIEYNDVTYSPLLSSFEGFDEVGNKVTLTVVFQIPEFNCGFPKENFSDLTLVFDDPYWDLGTVNFLFENKSLTRVPKLKL